MKRRHKRIGFIVVGLAAGRSRYLVASAFRIISSSSLVRHKSQRKKRPSIARFASAGSFRKAQ
jgi:hypothetical protein